MAIAPPANLDLSLPVVLPVLQVVKQDASTAVVEYQLSASGRTSPLMKSYLVKEGEDWFVDSPFGETPRWAVPSERIGVYDDVLKRINEYFTLRAEGDASKIEAFLDANFTDESVAVLIPVRSDISMRVLSPMTVNVGESKEVDGVKTVHVMVGLIESVRFGTEKEITRMWWPSYFFVEKGGMWKLHSAHNPSPEELVARFTYLWQKGKTRLMDRLMAADAGICLGKSSETTWSNEKGALPAVQAIGEVTKVRDIANNSVPAVSMAFENGAAWPSGVYQFDIVSGQYGRRIKTIRFMGQDAGTGPPSVNGNQDPK